jgi:hypothetical protein
MYLPYGVDEQGQLVDIDQVARGKTTLCCPYCGVRLLARKGERLAPHFAHDGKTCREAKRSDRLIALPVYDSFRLHLSGKAWEALRAFHDEHDDFEGGWLEDLGLVKSFITPYGNERYTLTHQGKIPFGELSLNLFNQFQEPLIRARHDALEQAALAALYTAEENTALTDLRLFRAQMKRILETSLYFIEVRTLQGILHKIGVTTRPLEQRLAEIRADLSPHIGEIELVPLGVWRHRGNVELYFKHRYRRFQHPIATLTEYFAFDDVKAVLRDLRRMKPKELIEAEQSILAGESSRVERRELTHAEMLSQEAWGLLCHFSSDAAKSDFRSRLELQQYRLGNSVRPLIEFTQIYPVSHLQVTEYGRAYHAGFAQLYRERYAEGIARG